MFQVWSKRSYELAGQHLHQYIGGREREERLFTLYVFESTEL